MNYREYVRIHSKTSRMIKEFSYLMVKLETDCEHEHVHTYVKLKWFSIPDRFSTRKSAVYSNSGALMKSC